MEPQTGLFTVEGVLVLLLFRVLFLLSFTGCPCEEEPKISGLCIRVFRFLELSDQAPVQGLV